VIPQDTAPTPKLTSAAHRYLAQATVKPHWLSASAFWYRRTAASDDTTEFLFVDAESSARRPAFDHAALATKLAEQTGQAINPASLPFAWIELDADAASVRFRFDGKVYQFRSDDGALELWTGNFGTKLVRVRRLFFFLSRFSFSFPHSPA
jgi:hypothetical protein